MCRALGELLNAPRRRGHTVGEAWVTHEAYMGKLRDAFAQSFGCTPTGQQSHDVGLLSFAEGSGRRREAYCRSPPVPLTTDR